MTNLAGQPAPTWPYAAAITGVFMLVFFLVYKFGGVHGKRPNAWRYTAELDQCRKMIGAGQLAEAAAFLKPLLRKNDISSDFFDLAGIAADRQGKTAEAGRYWRLMMRYYPAQEGGYIRTARFLLQHGKVKQAFRVLKRARGKVVNTAVLVAVRAEAAQAAEQWDEAIRLWAELRESTPGYIDGYLQARICLIAAGRDAEADALLADVAARMPNNPTIMKVVKDAAARAAETAAPQEPAA